MKVGNLTETYKPSSKFTPIREWREDDRPRERLVKYGPESLSDAELIAILLGFGKTGKSAVDIARDLLNKYGGVAGLAKCDYSQFKSIEGIGEAKAVTIAAVFEISRRIVSPPFNEKAVFRSPEDVAEYYIPRLRDNRTETFRALLLNSSNQIFREVVVSEGTLNSSLVHAREVYRIAIVESAASIILLHNHPSGNTSPSQEDINITRQLEAAGNTIGIKVLDHLIIAGGRFTSLKASGLI